MDALWTLSSSDGWNRCSGRVRRSWTDGRRVLLLFDVTLSGRFWQRDADEFSALRDDFICRLPQVIVGRDKLKELLDALAQWLSSSRPISIGLCDEGAQRLWLSFDVSDAFICSMDRPVCEIRYAAERMPEGRWNFVVDQSCIRQLHEDLVRVLRAFNGPG